jgi:hypothetical protein
MSSYFQNFEMIRYNNAVMINITQRAAILNKVFGNRYAFYPYLVKNGMRAEEVAERYYGDPNFVWLVYFSNDIIDPYHQWTMDEETFKTHVNEKYGSIQAAAQKIISYRVNWYEDTTILSKSQFNVLSGSLKKYWTPRYDNSNVPISYVRKELNYSASTTNAEGDVILNVPDEELSYWVPVSAYEYEEEENRKKANIRLIDSRLAKTAETNLRELLRA